MNIFQKDTCAPIFIAALFTIAKTWKQPRCPSADEQIKKILYKHTYIYIYIIEYYSAIKNNEIMPFVACMNLEIDYHTK